MGNRHPSWEELLVVPIGVTIFFRVKHTLSHKLASQAELSKMFRKGSALQEEAGKHVLHLLQEKCGSREHITLLSVGLAPITMVTPI